MKQRAFNKSTLASYLLLPLVTLFAFSSCTKELKLPSAGQKKKIVLLGELVAGDSITIRGAQSLTLSTSDTKFELPSGLLVSLKSTSGTIPLAGVPDDLSGLIFSIPFKSEERIEAGSTYTVTANHSVMGTATAQVRIPAPFAVRVRDTGTAIYNSSPAYRVSVEIEDNPNEENFYVIEAVKQSVTITPIVFPDPPYVKEDTTYNESYTRQSIYSNDPASENIATGTASRLNRRILFSDKRFRGNIFRTDVYIPTLPVVLDTFFVSDGELYRTILFVKSVSKEYYEFLKSYEQYEPASGFNTTAAPIRVEGNVQGGLGMVGGAYRRRFYFWIEQLL